MGDEGEDHRTRIAELRSRSPGEEESDPYADTDIGRLPEWWREAIEEFEAHDLRPYQPARFEDGALVPEIVAELQAQLEISIQFTCFNPDADGSWEIRIDGTTVRTVGYRRSPEGYSVFGMTSDEFEQVVRDYIATTDG